jgi:hypothetical protein
MPYSEWKTNTKIASAEQQASCQGTAMSDLNLPVTAQSAAPV